MGHSFVTPALEEILKGGGKFMRISLDQSPALYLQSFSFFYKGWETMNRRAYVNGKRRNAAIPLVPILHWQFHLTHDFAFPTSTVTPLTFSLKSNWFRKNSFFGIMVSIFILHEQDMFEINLGYFQGSSRDFCGRSVSVYKAEFANYF